MLAKMKMDSILGTLPIFVNKSTNLCSWGIELIPRYLFTVIKYTDSDKSCQIYWKFLDNTNDLSQFFCSLWQNRMILFITYILSDMTNSMLGKLLLQFPPSKIWNYVCYLLLILYPKWGTYLLILFIPKLRRCLFPNFLRGYLPEVPTVLPTVFSEIILWVTR